MGGWFLGPGVTRAGQGIVTRTAVESETSSRANSRDGQVVEIGSPVLAMGKNIAPIMSNATAPITAPAKPATAAGTVQPGTAQPDREGQSGRGPREAPG